MKDLVEFLKYSGPAGFLILVGFIWGKKLIEYFFDETIELKKHEFNLELEKHKIQIDNESKNFQHLLDTKLNEFNIKHSKLHEERTAVIKELYFKLVELQSAMYVFTRRAHRVNNDFKKEEEGRIERLNKALNDYNNFYLPNKIYFNPEIVMKLENISKEYWNKGWDFAQVRQQLHDNHLPKEAIKEYIDKIKNISDLVEVDFSKLIQEIENEFRKILGVE